MNNLEITIDLTLIEQTAPHFQMTAHCLCSGVRQVVRILDRADQLADAHEHIEPVLSASLFVDILHDDDHAAQLISLITKRHTEHARPDLFSISRGVKHFATGTD